MHAATAEADRWHAGLNLRSELGTHPIRIDVGVGHGRLDLIAVLDPMFWTDGEIDVDAIAAWRITESGYAALAGWRPASIAIGPGRQFQHSVLAGGMGPLPDIGPFDLQWGIELAAVILKHGGSLPSDTTSFRRMADIGDNLNVSMFLRVGYASAR